MKETCIIVAVDECNGIAKNGIIPWHCPEDLKFVKKVTTEVEGTALIMGRKTWETIPVKYRPLKDRINIVLSRSAESSPRERDGAVWINDLEVALKYCNDQDEINRIFIFGGAAVYDEYLRYHTPDVLYRTTIMENYNCDQKFNFDYLYSLSTIDHEQYTNSEVDNYDIQKFVFGGNKEEEAYLNLFRQVLRSGTERVDRTGVGTIATFAEKLEFDLSYNVIPVLTTKRVAFKTMSKELMWFISGSTDTNLLEKQGVKIWKGNTSREFLDSRGLTDYEVGELGPGYGFQWRHAGAKYEGMNADYMGKGVDQLQSMIDKIKTNPHDRRILMSAWNVAELDNMALPPCHMMFQLFVRGDKLDGQMYQRSADSFLGVGFNIASYALLLHIIAQITGLKAGKLTMVFGDYHIYKNHVEQVKTQLQRKPYPFPKIRFNRDLKDTNINDVKLNDFTLMDYKCHPSIKAEMAV